MKTTEMCKTCDGVLAFSCSALEFGTNSPSPAHALPTCSATLALAAASNQSFPSCRAIEFAAKTRQHAGTW